MKYPRPAWARRSTPGLSECRLVAGIEPAKSQLMPITCSRATPVDGADIARAAWTKRNVCLKRLMVMLVDLT